jgi:hypothetical protein
LQTIGFNGGTVAKIGLKALEDRSQKYRILLLPSSSPAYTRAYAKKICDLASTERLASNQKQDQTFYTPMAII